MDVDVGGDLKSFFVGSVPYEDAPFEAFGQGVVDGRGKLTVGGERWSFVAHHAVTAKAPGGVSSFVGTGAGLEAPEVVDLSWSGVDEAGLVVSGRTDRLVATLKVPHLTLAAGRQPVSFGKTFFFTPMDLVNPFSPGVVDQDYKPGVDAVRADAFYGTATTVTVVGAYAGDWDAEGLIGAAYAQTTFGVWDVGAFAGAVRGDRVLGACVAGSAGPVGVRGEGTWTSPPDDEEPFVRAALGADWRPAEDTSLSVEAYYQTLGAEEPAEYLAFAMTERYARGELWTMGRAYAAVSVAQQIVPTVNASLAVLANVEDPSAMVLPSLSVSVADNVDLSAGAYVGLGARPEGFALKSEFGLLPTTGFVRMGAYF